LKVTKLAPHLLDYEQQDCQEFLRFLLDGLSDDLARKHVPPLAIKENGESGIGAVTVQDLQNKKRSEDDGVSESPTNSPTKSNSTNGMTKEPRPPPLQQKRLQQEGTVSSPAIAPPTDSREVGANIERPQFSGRTAQRIRFMTSEAAQFAATPASASTGRELKLSTTGLRGNSLNQRSSSEEDYAKIDPPSRRLSSSDGASGMEALKHQESDSLDGALSGGSDGRQEVSIKGPSLSDISRASPRQTIGKSAIATGGIDSTITQSSSSGKMGTFRTLQQRARDRRGGDDGAIGAGEDADGATSPSSITPLHVEHAVDESEKAWSAYLQKNDSIITDIFGGQLQSSIECLTCHHRSLCFDPFLDLSIPIVSTGLESSGSRWGNRGDREPAKCSLQACLEEFSGGGYIYALYILHLLMGV
jgi:hypothetical protein